VEKKRGRGRPKITERLVGDSAEFYEKIMMGGRKFRSRRSVTDTVYAMKAGEILLEAASDINDLNQIFIPDEYMCRSILSQLGRMYLVENFDTKSVVTVARLAIDKKMNGCSVKDIEKYIRNGRQTDEW